MNSVALSTLQQIRARLAKQDTSMANVQKRTFMFTDEEVKLMALASFNSGAQARKKKMMNTRTEGQEKPGDTATFWKDASNLIARLAARAQIELKRSSNHPLRASEIKKTLQKLQENVNDAKMLFMEELQSKEKANDDEGNESQRADDAWPGPYGGRSGQHKALTVNNTSSGSETSMSGKEQPNNKPHLENEKPEFEPRADPDEESLRGSEADPRADTHPSRTAVIKHQDQNELRDWCPAPMTELTISLPLVTLCCPSKEGPAPLLVRSPPLAPACLPPYMIAQDDEEDASGEDVSESTVEECYACGVELYPETARVCATDFCQNLVCPHCIDEALPHCDYCIDEHLY